MPKSENSAKPSRAKAKTKNQNTTARTNKRQPSSLVAGVAFIISVCIIVLIMVTALVFTITYNCNKSWCISIENNLLGITHTLMLPEYSLNPNQGQKKVVGFGDSKTLPVLSDINSAIAQNNPHVYLVNGYNSHYRGADWWTVQQYDGWDVMELDSATVRNNRDITLYDKKGGSYNVPLLGIEKIDLDAPYGQASAGEIQKCVDAGSQSGTLRVYYQGGPSSGVILASFGKNCALELLKAGDAKIETSDSNRLPEYVYYVLNKHHQQAKTSKLGLYGM